MRFQRVGEHRAVPWRNGAGVTMEIVVGGDPLDWDWRLSLATVAGDGPFSAFPEVVRQLVVVEGIGMVLTVDGIDVACRPDAVVVFDGGAVTSGRLVDGPVRDLNLMVRRGRASLRLSVVTGPAAVAGAVAAVALTRAHAAATDLGPYDALLDLGGAAVECGTGKLAFVIAGPGIDA